MHNKYPDEIEYFAMAFELIDSEGQTDSYFSFPLMPDGISISNSTNVGISKTMGGIVVNNNPTFTPFGISISGYFGKKFRKTSQSTSLANDLKQNILKEVGDNLNINSNVNSADSSQFSTEYKNGYGNTKILEKLLNKSKTLDKYSRTYRLILYNISFNQSFLVEMLPSQFHTDKSKNGMWSYSINLHALAPADAVVSKQRVLATMRSAVSEAGMRAKSTQLADLASKTLQKDFSYFTSLSRAMRDNMINKTYGKNMAVNGFSLISNLTSNPSSVNNLIQNVANNKIISAL
jgi:hypothetical protein